MHSMLFPEQTWSSVNCALCSVALRCENAVCTYESTAHREIAGSWCRWKSTVCSVLCAVCSVCMLCSVLWRHSVRRSLIISLVSAGNQWLMAALIYHTIPARYLHITMLYLHKTAQNLLYNIYQIPIHISTLLNCCILYCKPKHCLSALCQPSLPPSLPPLCQPPPKIILSPISPSFLWVGNQTSIRLIRPWTCVYFCR